MDHEQLSYANRWADLSGYSCLRVRWTKGRINCASASGCPYGTNGSIGVLLGNGDGSFQSAVNYNCGGYYAVAMVMQDVNGDGKPETCLIWCSRSLATVGAMPWNCSRCLKPSWAAFEPRKARYYSLSRASRCRCWCGFLGLFLFSCSKISSFGLPACSGLASRTNQPGTQTEGPPLGGRIRRVRVSTA